MNAILLLQLMGTAACMMIRWITLWFNFLSAEEFVSYDASQLNVEPKEKEKRHQEESKKERIRWVEEKEEEEKKRKKVEGVMVIPQCTYGISQNPQVTARTMPMPVGSGRQERTKLG